MVSVVAMNDTFDPNYSAGWPASAYVMGPRPLLLLYRGPSLIEGHEDGASRAIFVYDLEARRVRFLFAPTHAVQCFLVSENASRFAAATMAGDVHVWDSATLELVGTWTPLRKRDLGGDFLPPVLFSPEGDFLVAVRLQRDSLLPESIVRVPLDRPTPRRIAESDAIDLAFLRRMMFVAKVEPHAAGVWLAHDREPSLVRMRFGRSETRTVLRKYPIHSGASIPGAGIVFSDAQFSGRVWRFAELVKSSPDAPRRVTRLRAPSDVTVAWASSPSGKKLASLDQNGELVVRSTAPLRRHVRVSMPQAESAFFAFHGTVAIANDGVTWVRGQDGLVHRIAPDGQVSDSFRVSVG